MQFGVTVLLLLVLSGIVVYRLIFWSPAAPPPPPASPAARAAPAVRYDGGPKFFASAAFPKPLPAAIASRDPTGGDTMRNSKIPEREVREIPFLARARVRVKPDALGDGSAWVSPSTRSSVSFPEKVSPAAAAAPASPSAQSRAYVPQKAAVRRLFPAVAPRVATAASPGAQSSAYAPSRKAKAVPVVVAPRAAAGTAAGTGSRPCVTRRFPRGVGPHAAGAVKTGAVRRSSAVPLDVGVLVGRRAPRTHAPAAGIGFRGGLGSNPNRRRIITGQRRMTRTVPAVVTAAGAVAGTVAKGGAAAAHRRPISATPDRRRPRTFAIAAAAPAPAAASSGRGRSVGLSGRRVARITPVTTAPPAAFASTSTPSRAVLSPRRVPDVVAAVPLYGADFPGIKTIRGGQFLARRGRTRRVPAAGGPAVAVGIPGHPDATPVAAISSVHGRKRPRTFVVEAAPAPAAVPVAVWGGRVVRPGYRGARKVPATTAPAASPGRVVPGPPHLRMRLRRVPDVEAALASAGRSRNGTGIQRGDIPGHRGQRTMPAVTTAPVAEGPIADHGRPIILASPRGGRSIRTTAPVATGPFGPTLGTPDNNRLSMIQAARSIPVTAPPIPVAPAPAHRRLMSPRRMPDVVAALAPGADAKGAATRLVIPGRPRTLAKTPTAACAPGGSPGRSGAVSQQRRGALGAPAVAAAIVAGTGGTGAYAKGAGVPNYRRRRSFAVAGAETVEATVPAQAGGRHRPERRVRLAPSPVAAAAAAVPIIRVTEKYTPETGTLKEDAARWAGGADVILGVSGSTEEEVRENARKILVEAGFHQGLTRKAYELATDWWKRLSDVHPPPFQQQTSRIRVTGLSEAESEVFVEYGFRVVPYDDPTHFFLIKTRLILPRRQVASEFSVFPYDPRNT